MYEKGDYEGAINATNKEQCKWKDYELLFSSYMAVYLRNPNPTTHDAALQAISEFRSKHVIDGSVDPGPLYIALGDISGAKDWYREVAAIDPSHREKNKRSAKNAKSAAMAALKVLNSQKWSPSQKIQLLKQLAQAIDSAVAGR